MIYQKNSYRISDDKNDIQLDKLHALLKTSYWANKRDLDTIKCSIEHSECFCLFDGDNQIGFARVVTDFASVAYIADVIVNDQYRANGLGKWLVEVVVNDPRWKSIFKLLATDDAHTLYERFGFVQSSMLMSTAKSGVE